MATDESLSFINNDSSLNSQNSSKETETSTSTNLSFDSSTISSKLKNQIIIAVASNLNDIIEENKAMIPSQIYDSNFINQDIFYLNNIPNITLLTYINHLVKYTKMDISSLIIAVIYIDTFCSKYKYILTMNNIYRLLLAACILSLKFNEDITIDSNAYAVIAGVSRKDLNALEVQLYVLLEYKLFVDEFLYQQYYTYFSKFGFDK